MHVFTNGCAKQGKAWYSDGSKLEVDTGNPTRQRAGTSVTCGPLRVTTRTQGPQTSYRAELQGAVIAAALADGGDSITIDNQAVVRCGAHRPHREAADMDYRERLANTYQSKTLALQWIPSHRTIIAKCTQAEREEIRRNDEVDELAKMATSLPLPPASPATKASIILRGTEAPTPAKKWLLNYRRYGVWKGTPEE